MLSIENQSEINPPLITIITVVLNGKKHLEQTFQSVFNQTYTNIEYIVIDGGSTDGSLEIIKKYATQIDYWISEPDKGLYDAMNKGIALAKGELVGIINADDYYATNTVQLVASAYLNIKADIYHGDMIILNGVQNNRCRPDYEKMMQLPSIFHPTCFVKKSVYEVIGAFDTQYKISADYDFLLRCIKNNYVFEYLPEALTYFRPGGMSASCYVNIEGYKVMKSHNTGYQNEVIWRGIKCYIKTFLKNIIKFTKLK